jgi:hypothetical protein
LQYSVIKRLEHFFKGLANTESQISAIPPERYGDRFVKFISGVTKTKEAAEREKNEEALKVANDVTVPSMTRRSTDKVMEKAEHQLERSRKQGVNEHDVPNIAMRVVRSPSADRGEIGRSWRVFKCRRAKQPQQRQSQQRTPRVLAPAAHKRERRPASAITTKIARTVARPTASNTTQRLWHRQ